MIIFDERKEHLNPIWKNTTVDDIKSMIADGRNMSDTDTEGYNYLMMAVSHGASLNTVNAIIDSGQVDVNAITNHNLTALMLASQHSDDPQIIKTLIENGADKQAKDLNNQNARQLALQYKKTEIVKAIDQTENKTGS